MARTSQIKQQAAPKKLGLRWISQEELAERMLSTNQDGKITLPGYGTPLNYMLQHRDWSNDVYERCPNALQDWGAQPITVREKNMMQMINAITDKPDWRRKVFDEAILHKWRAEAVTEEGQGFTEEMFDYCTAELQEKASRYQKDGLVAVLDSEWAVVKSDDLISAELREELKAAVVPLETVPEEMQDWHPGSDNQVLDLVHPSLFPLVYGRSRILSTGTTTVDDCIQTCGKGDVVPKPSKEDCELGQQSSWLITRQGSTNYWSDRFQWLPSDVIFSADEGVKITSYINNLHPVHHASLYPVIEKFIAKAIPAWDLVLSSYSDYTSPESLRVPMHQTEYDFAAGEEPPDDVGLEHGEDSDEYYEAREKWVSDNRTLIKPNARAYDDSMKSEAPIMNLREHFSKSGIQVIVKLANIHLTPSKQEYSGGSWHIEGQLNEHICATALYYYDNKNITDSHLAFRYKVSVDTLEERQYGQDDNEGVCYLFDIERNGPGVQTIGQVLTQEGRLLAFPNVLQHQVQPFKLQDPTKPGHRKILALFLIDPFQRIISTANVPPQQREWWSEALCNIGGRLNTLPPELKEHVLNDVEDFPITLTEAKKLREELMQERGAFVDDVNQMYSEEEFTFCEH